MKEEVFEESRIIGLIKKITRETVVSRKSEMKYSSGLHKMVSRAVS